RRRQGILDVLRFRGDRPTIFAVSKRPGSPSQAQSQKRNATPNCRSFRHRRSKILRVGPAAALCAACDRTKPLAQPHARRLTHLSWHKIRFSLLKVSWGEMRAIIYLTNQGVSARVWPSEGHDEKAKNI